VEFRILGPVELWDGGSRQDLGSRKERCVLAVLLWEAGRPVSAETLIRRVWGDNEPRNALSSLYSNVSRIRARLNRVSGSDHDWKLSHAGSYSLDVSSADVDLRQFRGLRDEAKVAADSGDDARAFTLLGEAERLWRGDPLAGVDGAWAEGIRVRLNEERYLARLDWVAAGLRLGRYAEFVTEAGELADQDQFDETPVEYLMRALFMSGRRADALHAYREFRDRYAEATGNEPGARLRELQQQMLRDAPELTGPRLPAVAAASGSPRDTMPRDDPDFTGRARELALLSGWLEDGLSQPTVPVVVISGTPGVGKTALAVHAARTHADRYPNQLYVQLRGHAHADRPVDAGTALGTLLRALDVPDAIIPADTGDRAALWRSRLAGRKVLILLDDALDSAQVQPLLPGAPGCLVIVTTRHKALDLSGIRWLSLERMPPADAASLFVKTAGRDHLDGPAIASVLRLCDYLPLEIQLAGSELRRHPSWEVGDLAVRLRENRAADRPVGAALTLSCHYLTPGQRRLLRQVALHPGLDFSRYAAAAMAAGQSLTDVRQALDALTDYHLIDEPVSGRFAFHDLIREYALDLARNEDTDGDRDFTIRRLVGYYLWLADAADRAIFRFRPRLAVTVDAPANQPSTRWPDDYQRWLEAEQPAALAVARYAADQGLAEQAGLLASALASFLDTRSCWAEGAELHQRAVDAWRWAGNRRGEARALTDLCRAFGRLGRHEEATDCAHRALVIARGEADRAGEAEILDNLGLILWQTSRFTEALAHYEQALTAWRELGDKFGQAEVLAHSATALWHLNEYPAAIRMTEQALVIYRALGDSRGEANTQNNLGEFHQDADRHEQALRSYQQALDIYRSLGDRMGEAAAVNNIGKVCLSTGRVTDALAHYRVALDIIRDLGNRRYEAEALSNIGAGYQRLGHYAAALDQYQKALVLAHDLGERFLEARSHRGSGDARLAAGHHADAGASYLMALEVSERIGDRYQEAQALHGLGQALANTGDVVAAAEHLHRALEIFTSIGRPQDAEAVHIRLRELKHDAA
jgi:tetratricopeptide (TPR) repeat protein/DNA-binding SARP family transcriptional activator